MHLIRQSWRHLIVFGLVGLLLLNSLRTLQQSVTRNPNELASIEVQPAAQKAQRLKPWLPTRGYIGYVSDNRDPSGYFRQYYATQYALAPLMFVTLGDLPQGLPFTPAIQPAQQILTGGLVIGNFQDPTHLQTIMQALDLEEVARAGPTLVLLRQRGSAAQSMRMAQLP
jgi:hypothetical protein